MSVAITASSSAPTLSGLASGMDWTSIINDMVAVEEAPETQMEAQQTLLKTEDTSYTTIGTDLAALQKDITTLMDPSFFENRTASAADASVASATAASRHSPGRLQFRYFATGYPRPPGWARTPRSIPSVPPMMFPASPWARPGSPPPSPPALSPSTASKSPSPPPTLCNPFSAKLAPQ